MERLWWTIDGWEFIILLWRDAEGRDRDAQRAAVTEIYRILPIIPDKEAANRPNLQAMQESTRMQVRALEGWNSGMLDIEMIHRVERSEEHTSELQSLMRISYAVFCLKKKKKEQK